MNYVIRYGLHLKASKQPDLGPWGQNSEQQVAPNHGHKLMMHPSISN